MNNEQGTFDVMILNRYFPFFAFLLVATLGACNNSTTTQPPGPTPVDTSLKRVIFSMDGVVGTTPFALDADFISPTGTHFKVTKFRYYLSQPALLDSMGRMVPITLVDSAGAPIPFNLILIDYEIPSSLTFSMMAPPGSYTGMVVSVGVPLYAPNGDTLNHSDASLHNYPLNVDADMYWGWKPGYIHFKIEGVSQIAGKGESFIYHLGEEKRLATIGIRKPITISATEGLRQTLVADIYRLFVTPSGVNSPDIGGALSDRVANSGRLADTVAQNIRSSGFMTLRP